MHTFSSNSDIDLCTSWFVCVLGMQGVKAGQRDAEVKSLKARLKASEQSAEIIKSFSSPQVHMCIRQ